MYDYETVAVLHPDLGDAGAKEFAERIRSILETGKATIKRVEEWGLRQLTHLIRAQSRGYYVLIEYSAEPAAVTEMERQLRLNDRVLRFLTVRQVHKKMLPPRRARTESAEEDRGA